MMSLVAGESEGKPLLQTCEQNLRAIHDAVIIRRRMRGRLPDSLSELSSAGLIDPELLICPMHKQAGTNRPANAHDANNFADDPLTLYNWQFGGRTDTQTGFLLRDLHERQARMGLGDWVPIVRCDQHPKENGDTHLNLTLGGAIFPSSKIWEFRLRHLLPYPYLRAKAIVTPEPLIPLRDRIPPRSSDSGKSQIDLGMAFNGALSDPWPEGYPGEEAPEILRRRGPDGLWQLNGTAFEIRGVVQLEGRGAANTHKECPEARFPAASREITVETEAAQIILLAGVIRDQPAGTLAATLTITIDSGQRLEFPLRHGIEISHAGNFADSRDIKMVWSRATPLPQDTAARCLSMITWKFGKKVRIRSLKFSAGDAASYPFLLAATVE